MADPRDTAGRALLEKAVLLHSVACRFHNHPEWRGTREDLAVALAQLAQTFPAAMAVGWMKDYPPVVGEAMTDRRTHVGRALVAALLDANRVVHLDVSEQTEAARVERAEVKAAIAAALELARTVGWVDGA